MGTITGTQIVAIARSVSNLNTTRWSDADVLPLVNEALRDLVVLHPQANAVTSIPTLAAGTRQTMAGLSLTSGIQFIDFVRNFDSGGTTPGLAIRRVDGGRKFFDQYRPGWHSDSASAVIRHFMTDEEDPTVAWVWPPANGSGKAQVIYSALPTALGSLGTAIPIDDHYANPLGYLTLARMYERNEPGTLSRQSALEARALAAQVLGVRTGMIARLDASTEERPG